MACTYTAHAKLICVARMRHAVNVSDLPHFTHLADGTVRLLKILNADTLPSLVRNARHAPFTSHINKDRFGSRTVTRRDGWRMLSVSTRMLVAGGYHRKGVGRV